MQLTAVKNLSSGGGLKVDYGTIKIKVQMSFSFQPMLILPDVPIFLIYCEPYAGGSSGGHFYRFVPKVSSIAEAENHWNYLDVNIGFHAHLSTNYQGRFCRVGNMLYCAQNVTDSELELHYALIS